MRRKLLWLFLLLFILWPALALTAQSLPAFDLAGAIAAAQPGATIHVPPGVYHGTLKITKAVTLIGDGNPVLEGTGQGDVVTITAADVTLRGFVIRNSGDSLDRENAGITGLAGRLTIENNRLENVLFGIYLKNAPHSVVRNNLVFSKNLEMGRRGDGLRLWYCEHSLVEGNHVQGSRDVIIWFSPHTVTRNNLVEESRYGLHFMSTDDQLLENNVLRHNSVGLYLMYGTNLTVRNNIIYNNRGPSGYGMGVKGIDNLVIEGNRLVNNRVGMYIDESPREPNATVLFDHNLLAYNEIGIALLPLVKHNTYSNNIFQENGEQIAINGGGELHDNHWSQDGQGNFWSDYVGFDANGDHIGDLPYRAQSLYEDLLEKYPELRLFQLSPATQALDLAARAFPIFQPRAKMVDDHPLMAPPVLGQLSGMPTAPFLQNLLTTGVLVLIAVAVLGFGRRGWSIR